MILGYIWFGLVVVLTLVLRAHRNGQWPPPRGVAEIILDIYILAFAVLVWPAILAVVLLGLI